MNEVTYVRTITSTVTVEHPADLTPEQRKHLGLDEENE